MLGLFGTLNLGTRSLQTQRTGVEVAGQNLANVTNEAYARQRVTIQTSPSLATAIGMQGTGAEAIGIRQLRDSLLDGHIQNELSVGGYWDAQQRALQYGQTYLGEFIDRQADSLSSTTATSDGSTRGLADELTGLFNAFQSVATTPDSITERQLLLSQAQALADRFNQTGSQLDGLRNTLNDSLNTNVTDANDLLKGIADLNDQIANAEFKTGGAANDLRDLRQQKLESLAKLVNFDTTANPNGSLNISIGGTTLVSDRRVLDTLQTYDAGGGQFLVRTTTSGTPLTLTGGAMQGTIDARDGTLAKVRAGLDTLASQLITEVNTLHRSGFSLTGSTGADFFSGTSAATIGVNAALAGNPSLIQAAGVNGTPGDNTVALAIAKLAESKIAGLGNQTFANAYGQSVATIGQSLSDANNQLADHDSLQTMLLRQRDSVSGVSVDEEMSDLVKFQKAYEASAKLVNTVDEMLDTVISLKR